MILLLGYLTSENYGTRFTGYQYYSLVILPFCIAMAIITAAYAGKDDAFSKTAVRLLVAPVSNLQIVLAKLFSCSIVISCCNLLVLLFSLLVLKLPVGKVILPVLLLLSAETFAVCAIGLFIGFGMKNFIVIKNLLNIPIAIAAVLAGAFFPIGSFSRGLGFMIKLSPLTWVNRSLFLCIYDSSQGLLLRTALVCAVVGVVFTLLAGILFKKEEFIHGDLPGYEK
jgi:ABC-2 type transport system permease protein